MDHVYARGARQPERVGALLAARGRLLALDPNHALTQQELWAQFAVGPHGCRRAIEHVIRPLEQRNVHFLLHAHPPSQQNWSMTVTIPICAPTRLHWRGEQFFGARGLSPTEYENVRLALVGMINNMREIEAHTFKLLFVQAIGLENGELPTIDSIVEKHATSLSDRDLVELLEDGLERIGHGGDVDNMFVNNPDTARIYDEYSGEVNLLGLVFAMSGLLRQVRYFPWFTGHSARAIVITATLAAPNWFNQERARAEGVTGVFRYIRAGSIHNASFLYPSATFFTDVDAVRVFHDIERNADAIPVPLRNAFGALNIHG